jgi:hypothetical protein
MSEREGTAVAGAEEQYEGPEGKEAEEMRADAGA